MAPNMFGGDQWSEDYNPVGNEEIRRQERREKKATGKATNAIIQIIRQYAEEYQLEEYEGVPDELERAMLEDFALGLLEVLQDAGFFTFQPAD